MEGTEDLAARGGPAPAAMEVTEPTLQIAAIPLPPAQPVATEVRVVLRLEETGVMEAKLATAKEQTQRAATVVTVEKEATRTSGAVAGLAVEGLRRASRDRRGLPARSRHQREAMVAMEAMRDLPAAAMGETELLERPTQALLALLDRAD
jgi:hypothetical protein